MVVDYFILRRRRVNIEALYIADRRSEYFYRHGVNPRAVAAFVPAAVLSVIVAVMPQFSSAAPFAWYVGVTAAALFYYLLTRHGRSTAGAPTQQRAAASRRVGQSP
jgi:NCS1 family nucleobase:cation symporter-1